MPNALICDNHFPVAHSGFGNVWGGSNREFGGVAPSSQRIFTVFIYINTYSNTFFFIEKGRAVSAVTMDNVKVFSQLVSKSRSLAKISERRLQPLLV